MTVQQPSSKITYAADGSTTNWSFPFAFQATFINIHVYITSAVGSVIEVPSAQFTVVPNAAISPNPTPVGGYVVYPIGNLPPLAVGNSITISRWEPSIQGNAIANQSIIYPPIIEIQFDYLTMVDQQLTDLLYRAVTVPISDPPLAPLPPASVRANQQAVFDANGNMVAGGAVVGTIISSVMVPVVTAPTLAQAQAAMHVAPISSPAFTGTPTVPTPAPGDNSSAIADTAYVQAAMAGAGMAMTTGDLKPTHKTVADPGWIMWMEGGIGDAQSTGALRANADTQNLFTLYYNNYPDAICPLYPLGSNTTTTRAAQGTAAQAYAAHCRIWLPPGNGRGLGVAGSGSGLTTRTLGSTFGSEAVTMTVAQMPYHGHGINDPTHAHSVADPTHAHAVADPTHTHGWDQGVAPITIPAGGNPYYGSGGGPFVQDNILPAATGISIYGAYTGIGIYANYTGVSVIPSGGNAPMNVMNPMAYVNIMVKL